jgi:hypothetical protein
LICEPIFFLARVERGDKNKTASKQIRDARTFLEFMAFFLGRVSSYVKAYYTPGRVTVNALLENCLAAAESVRCGRFGDGLRSRAAEFDTRKIANELGIAIQPASAEGVSMLLVGR